MPKATSSGTTSRRAALRSFAATATVSFFRWPAKPAQSGPRPCPSQLPDWLTKPPKGASGGLAGLCARFVADFRAYQVQQHQAGDAELDEATIDAAIDRREEILASIAATPAKTMHEMRAKALVLLEYASVMVPHTELDFDHRLAASIARDLVRIA